MTRFPNGFLWGAATSAHQVEGNNTNSDWWEWEQRGLLKYPSGVSCRQYELFRQDFDLAGSLGHNAHRFSVEWARIEPAEGRYSDIEIDHYRQVVSALRERDLEPIVTLHHFTNPAWFLKKGGWANAASADIFLGYARRVIEALAGQVRFWVTINEPTIYTYFSYLEGTWPPQVRSVYKAWKVMRNMRRAHIKVYRFLHSYYKDKGLAPPLAGAANNMQFYQPSPDTARNRFCAYLRDRLFNLGFTKKLFRADALDYIGLNYYSRCLVDARRWSLKSMLTDNGFDGSGTVKKNSLGWDIYPQGLYRVLMGLKRFAVPVLILENGICTHDDELRWEFIREHLQQAARAMQEGVRLLGYIYWSLTDNFEWDKGFEPRFGLIEVDYDTSKRTVRASSRSFCRVCRTNELI